MNCDIRNCNNKACYCSNQWLISGGMIVLYFCEQHAILNSEYFDDQNFTAEIEEDSE